MSDPIPPTKSEQRRRKDSPAQPGLLSAALALVGISALAIALPLFSTLGEGAAFFVAHRAAPADIVLFALGVYLLPPLALLLVAAVPGLLHASLRLWGVGIGAGLLTALWLLGLARELPTVAALLIAGAGGALLAAGYIRRAPVRAFLPFVGAVSPLVLLHFLLLSPAARLLAPDPDIDRSRTGGLDTPVVMLVLDELSQAAISLPDGRVDAGRLPNFARLAAMTTWYTDTVTASTQTERAIVSILTGLHTGEGTVPAASHFPHNIFTALAPSHRVSAIETVSRLCPARVCAEADTNTGQSHDRAVFYTDVLIAWAHTVLPVALAERYLPPVSSRWKNFAAQLATQFTTEDGSADTEENKQPHWWVSMVADMADNDRDRFDRFLRQTTAGGPGRFDYLHLALPHVPFIYLPDGRVYNGRFNPGQSARQYAWLDNQFLVDQGVLRYSLQVEYVDRLLGEWLDALEAHPHFEDTLLIVVSDHGLAFVPGEKIRRAAGATLTGAARVPLFIKYPGQRTGTVDKRRAETTDILPTVLDVLGLPRTESLDGQSLLGPAKPERERFIWEARDNREDIENAMNMGAAIERIGRVIRPGVSALDSIVGPGGDRGMSASAAMSSKEMFPGEALQEKVPQEKVPQEKIPQEKAPRLRLERGEWYRQVQTDSPFLPARLTGWLEGAPPGTRITVALNGTIAGGGESFGADREVSILLDPRLFREGHNSISAFLPGGSVDVADATEIPVVETRADWRLRWGENGELLQVQSGDKTWVADSETRGHAAFSMQSSAVGSIGGWAWDASDNSAATRILLLDGQTPVTSGFRRLALPIPAAQQGLDESLPFGFSLSIGPDTRERGGQLSVVALFDNGGFIRLYPSRR